MSVLVVVDARFTRRSGQDLCTLTRRAPRCAPVFHEGREQREDALRYQPKKQVRVAPEPRARIEARLEGVEAQPRGLAGEHEDGGERALLRGGVGVAPRHPGAARLPLAPRARLRRDIAASAESGDLGGLALGILYA